MHDNLHTHMGIDEIPMYVSIYALLLNKIFIALDGKKGDTKINLNRNKMGLFS